MGLPKPSKGRFAQASVTCSNRSSGGSVKRPSGPSKSRQHAYQGVSDHRNTNWNGNFDGNVNNPQMKQCIGNAMCTKWEGSVLTATAAATISNLEMRNINIFPTTFYLIYCKITGVQSTYLTTASKVIILLTGMIAENNFDVDADMKAKMKN